MIDLEQIGFNVLQKDRDGTTEITGGLTLTVSIKISSLIPDHELPDVVEHVKKRIREKIWEMAYGHLKEPVGRLKKLTSDPWMSDLHTTVNGMIDAVDKLEEAIGEP